MCFYHRKELYVNEYSTEYFQLGIPSHLWSGLDLLCQDCHLYQDYNMDTNL